MIPIAIFLAAAFVLWALQRHVDPPDDGRCELMRNPEVGLPERCLGRAVGLYTDAFGTQYPACAEHTDEALAR